MPDTPAPPPRKRSRVDRLFKPAVFVAACIPLALLLWGFWRDTLGANPIDEITDRTGHWTLRFLLITLSITPLRKLTGWNALQRVRRGLGLFAFFYGSLHLTTYLWLDKFFAWREILADIPKRKFITAGLTAWTLMVPLALTSTAAMVRRLGGKRWQKLHRIVYASALAGVVHFLWLVKADLRLPFTYGTILAVLLLLRIPPVADRLARVRRLARVEPTG